MGLFIAKSLFKDTHRFDFDFIKSADLVIMEY